MRFLMRRTDVMRQLAIGLLLAVIACMLLSAQAMAQDAAGTTIDLWPYIEPLVEIAFVVALGFASLLVRRGLTWLGVHLDDRRRQLVDDGLYKALSLGRAKLVDRLQGMSAIEIRNETVREGARFMLDTYLESLTSFGITPEGVRDRLLLRYADLFPDPAEPEKPTQPAKTADQPA